MVLESKSILSIPMLRGNPFDSRPIESSRVNEIVGRDDLLSSWAELVRSGSTRMLLLVGEKGSGKTSIINTISTISPISTICQYWPEENQLVKVLHELSVSLEGFEVPSTVHRISESLVNSLESKSGSLPLIALDFPSNVSMDKFLPRIIPILQRLRALVIISLTPHQFSSLDNEILNIFDTPVHLDGLKKDNIQTLVDKRIRKKAKERWILSPTLLQLLYDKTSGNPRALVNILQNLVDEHRGIGAFGSLDKLHGWKNENTIKSMEKQNDIEDTHKPSSNAESIQKHKQDILNQEVEKDQNEQVQILEELNVDNNDFTLINWSDDSEINQLEEDSVEIITKEEIKITESEKRLDYLWKEEEELVEEEQEEGEGIFNPSPPKSNIVNFGAFGAMIARSRDLSENINLPGKKFNEEYIDASSFEIKDKLTQKDYGKLEENIIANAVTKKESYNLSVDKLVADTDGEVWTVDQENEQSLPISSIPNKKITTSDNISEQNILHETISDQIFFDSPVNDQDINDEDNYQRVTQKIKTKNLLSPKWDTDMPFNLDYASQLSDTENIVVSKAMERDISPSDSELQALLQVGRPRLSQIYNGLNKAGILSVRKKGRSRLFKISAAAKSYF
ncbi:MAG: hypothetical protein CND89_05735 [Marine Group II euryarchaeote MED-G38]|nr:MAG: hypothetical protein CND89_05735 [Marine Group II euryarchaeote MED-G38]